MKSHSESYRAAGVDITAGYRAVELMKQHVARTMTPGVLEGLGGFGGLFELDLTGMTRPVLVSGTDGVGTNLDYIACGQNVPERIAAIVSGVAEGCVQAGCALIGGETAEMPGFYPEDEYDLAGFVVGAVDKSRLFNRMHMRAGDVVLALPSSGVHSNGFSLVRKVLPDRSLYVEELGATLGEALLVPTKIYVKPVLALAERIEVKGASHITGGGFYENVPRCLPSGLSARIEKKAVRTPPIFDVIQKAGNVPERDMFNTFNMGVGMCLIVDKEDADTALSIVKDAYVLGELVKGDGGIELCE